jgi:ribosome biogenesis GTPase A
MDMYQKRKMREEKKNNNQEEKLTKVGINWYPGHMVKAQNDIKAAIKLIDIVVEVLDARIPLSSRNPLIDDLAKDKQRIVVLNKSDLADEKETENWIKYFESKDISCIAVNSSVPQDIKKIITAIINKGKIVYKDKVANTAIDYKPIYRVLIAGIPNVGKSTIINKIAKRNAANVSNKPGVTVRNQWIRVQDNIDLLDTPGLLWPKLDDNNAGEKLALTGNIKQEILDLEGLACIGIEYLLNVERYKKMFLEKYKIDEEDIEYLDSYDILELLGRKRGCLVSGGNVNTEKASKIFLDELKSGKIGRISLENI